MEPLDSDRTSASPRRGASCAACRNGEPLDFDFRYAFQPILDVAAGMVFAHEALIRGPNGEGAMTVLDKVTDENRYRFDQACRTRAIETAARIGMQSRLSINFLPNAIYRPEVCIRTTLQAAQAHGFPLRQIIFEAFEGERVEDARWLAEVFREYQRMGFMTAIDDFGAGYAGLALLADFQPDLVKLDMGLIRGIDARAPAQVIVRNVTRMCQELGIRVIAEGIETAGEFDCLREMGIELMQGYWFCRPMFESCLHDATGVLPDADR